MKGSGGLRRLPGEFETTGTDHGLREEPSMAENRQFAQRLYAWQEELKNQIVTRVAPVSFSGCTTEGRLSTNTVKESQNS